MIRNPFFPRLTWATNQPLEPINEKRDFDDKSKSLLVFRPLKMSRVGSQKGPLPDMCYKKILRNKEVRGELQTTRARGR